VARGAIALGLALWLLHGGYLLIAVLHLNPDLGYIADTSLAALQNLCWAGHVALVLVALQRVSKAVSVRIPPALVVLTWTAIVFGTLLTLSAKAVYTSHYLGDPGQLSSPSSRELISTLRGGSTLISLVRPLLFLGMFALVLVRSRSDEERLPRDADRSRSPS
jgi:hypothetical protein